mgnify:CR=1 FL=1
MFFVDDFKSKGADLGWVKKESSVTCDQNFTSYQVATTFYSEIVKIDNDTCVYIHNKESQWVIIAKGQEYSWRKKENNAGISSYVSQFGSKKFWAFSYYNQKILDYGEHGG